MHRFRIIFRWAKRHLRLRARRAFLLFVAKAPQEAASTAPLHVPGDMPAAGEQMARDAMPELAPVAAVALAENPQAEPKAGASAPVETWQETEQTHHQTAPAGAPSDGIEDVQSAQAKGPEREDSNKQSAANIREVPSRRVTRLPSREDERHLRLLADLATAVWRLRQRMLIPGTDRPREQLAREYRDLEAVWDVLSAMQFEIQDHTGKQFDPGQSLRVATWIPVAGIEHDRVQETIKPTIYCAGAQIQRGIVIVETPERTPST